MRNIVQQGSAIALLPLAALKTEIKEDIVNGKFFARS
jgi:hypothetical protein